MGPSWALLVNFGSSSRAFLQSPWAFSSIFWQDILCFGLQHEFRNVSFLILRLLYYSISPPVSPPGCPPPPPTLADPCNCRTFHGFTSEAILPSFRLTMRWDLWPQRTILVFLHTLGWPQRTILGLLHTLGSILSQIEKDICCF